MKTHIKTYEVLVSDVYETTDLICMRRSEADPNKWEEQRSPPYWRLAVGGLSFRFDTKPDLKKGDRINITIEKVEPNATN